MADHSIFLFWSFLSCYYPPFISASFYNSAKEAEWTKTLPGIYKEGKGDNASRLSGPRPLRLSSRCVSSLPQDVRSDLEEKCKGEPSESSPAQPVSPLGCACAFFRNYTGPANDTVCAEMLRSCGDSSVATSVGLSLLLLLLLLACGVGCAWYRKCRDTRQFAFPRFLQRGGRGGRDYSKTLSLRRQGGGSRYKVPARTQAHRPAASDPDLCNDYENWEVGPALAEEGRKGLYENMQPPRLEEPVYGNEAWSHYCNVQKPLSPETPQEEDIYIVPD